MLVVETMRPKQWIKNTFVFAGVLFSGEFTDPDSLGRALLVFVGFCLVSGATYLLNDVIDAKTDVLNPRTARRPIARGDLRPATAIAAAVVCALAGIGGALLTGWQAAAVLLGYLVMQIAYSTSLKHVLFVDVMIIATGFTLRAVAGIVAIDVYASPWLLLCTGLLALFLGLVKRRGEAVALGGESNPQRPVLDYYSVGLLDELIAVITPSTVVVYALYAIQGARSDAMLLTLPFVIYGIFRLLFLMHHRSWVTDEPAALVLADRPLLVCVLMWALACLAITLAT
ncbi:MAG: hypothetical protein QOJ35_3116 [Solirubrobacteraceae bacterium]|nr:hypothetical protein [Solirubrobacteraceae bacterium]